MKSHSLNVEIYVCIDKLPKMLQVRTKKDLDKKIV